MYTANSFTFPDGLLQYIPCYSVISFIDLQYFVLLCFQLHEQKCGIVTSSAYLLIYLYAFIPITSVSYLCSFHIVTLFGWHHVALYSVALPHPLLKVYSNIYGFG